MMDSFRLGINIIIYAAIIPFIYMCLFNEEFISKKLRFYLIYIKKRFNVHYLYIMAASVILNVIFYFYSPLSNTLLPYDTVMILFSAIMGVIVSLSCRNKVFGKWIYGIYVIVVLVMYSMFGLNTSVSIWVFMITLVSGLYIAHPRRNKFHITAFLTATCVLILVNFLAVRTTIPTGSMEDTIPAGTNVIGNKIIYRFSKPRRGDIIGFREPVTERVEYSKRLVGYSGDTLNFSNEILGRRYKIDGLLSNEDIYVPKKGDVVKIKDVLKVKKHIIENSGQFLQLVNYKALEKIEAKELLKVLSKYGWTQKRVMQIVGNSEFIDIDVPESEWFYTYTLEVEGVSAKVLPIYEFRKNPEILKELLEGKSYTLKKDYILPLGDNTKSSFDGRFFGYVASDKVETNIHYGIFPFRRFK